MWSNFQLVQCTAIIVMSSHRQVILMRSLKCVKEVCIVCIVGNVGNVGNGEAKFVTWHLKCCNYYILSHLLPFMLCISTRELVLWMAFGGWTHLLGILTSFPITNKKMQKRKKNIQKDKKGYTYQVCISWKPLYALTLTKLNFPYLV